MPHDFKKFPELANSQMQFYYFDSPHKQILNDFRAKVVKVTDGDTIRVTCDFRDFNFPIRFARIDAPEKDTPEGVISKKWLEKLLLNEEIDILIDKNNRVGKWGRLIGEILHDGINVSQLSLSFNYSIPFGSKTFEKEMEEWL